LCHELLPVADLAGARRSDDGFDGRVHELVGHHHLYLDLGQEVDYVLGTSVEFGVPLLPSETFDLCHGQSCDPDSGQRLTNLVQLERFHDGLDLLHLRTPYSDPGGSRPTRTV